MAGSDDSGNGEPSGDGVGDEFADAVNNSSVEVADDIGDPEPLKENASKQDEKEFLDAVAEYSSEMLQVFQDSNVRGEALWLDFTATFRQHTIPFIPKALQVKWVHLLTERGIFVKRKQGFSRSRALVECLHRGHFVSVDGRDDLKDKRGEAQPLQGSESTVVPSSGLTYKPSLTKTPTRIIDVGGDGHENTEVPHADKKTQLKKGNAGFKSHDATIDREGKGEYERKGNGLGISGLMKSYHGRKQYSGSFDEDLHGAFEFYETMSRMCHLTDDEMAQSMPVMLKDEALSFYLSVYSTDDSYAKVSQKLIDNFMSIEQRNRTLVLWQSLRLSQAMREEPDKSELEVFRKFCHRLTQLQRQLDPVYRQDHFLRDQLVVSADTPQISQSMRERVPISSQDARNRIATFLSSEPRSAGAFTAGQIVDHGVNYSLGRKFGGEARKSLRGFHNRRQGRVSSRWIKGQKSCYVCGKDHLARTRHSKAEVAAAIERLRRNRPSAMITVEDLAFIAGELTQETEPEQEETDEIILSEDESEDSDTAYITEDAMEVHKSEEVRLANISYLHGRTFANDVDDDLRAMHAELSKGEHQRFKGIYIDTCANRSSVMSYSQFKAYCEEFQVPAQIEKNDSRVLKGLGGNSKSVGTATIPVPFKDLSLVIDVTFQIVSDNVPTLLSMKDMLDNGLDISIQEREVTYRHLRQPLILENYFLIHRWMPGDVVHSLYTEAELKKLHRVFGHPSVSSFVNILRRARPDEMSQDVRQSIQDLTKACLTCSVNASRPRRFKISVGSHALRFNHIVAIDIMYLSNRPVFHAVDEATHYNAALFLSRVSTSAIWKAFLRCWSRVYLGPPDFLRTDQGSNFVSKEFDDNAEADGIRVIHEPIECPTAMSHVERYHGPLKAAYSKIRADLCPNESDADCLQLAVKSINDTIGPEGLCPTLLVYGTIPRLARNTPAETQLARARAVDKAMDEVRKEQAKRRIAFGLKHSGGPKAAERSQALRRLPAGSPVFVYRKVTNRWEGPFPLIQVENETAVVQLPSGRKIFRTNVVKPMTDSELEAESIPSSYDSEHETQPITGHQSQSHTEAESQALLSGSEVVTAEAATTLVIKAMFGEDDLHMASNDSHTFAKSREAELHGLQDRKTFEVVDVKSVPQGRRIYGSRWVDVLKNVDGKTIEKSRLVAQNFRDHGAADIPTKSPTVTRIGQRIAVALAAMLQENISYVRDISQAYLQSESHLERQVYLKPPSEMNLPPGKVLLVLKPLYGIPESGLHWFITYSTHHMERLGMKATSFDPCILYKREDSKLSGVTVLQVDDSYGHGTKSFLDTEERESTRFKCKPRKILRRGDSSIFNGTNISIRDGGVHVVEQSDKLRNLKSPETAQDFVSIRAKAQYIGCCTRPDICSSVQLLASSAISPAPSALRALKKIVRRCHDTADVGLEFVPLDMNSLRLVLFTDASFANAENLKSQIGFVLVLADGSDNANIIHYGSSRCKRVTRSVMAAEIHALVYGFDNAFVVKGIIQEILGTNIAIDGYVDSKTLFNVVAKQASTLEKRLQIDVFSLRESHRRGELRYLAWIPGSQNVADGLTKGLVPDSHPLWKLMRGNKLNLKPSGWIDGTRQGEISLTSFQKEKTPECRFLSSTP